MGGSLNAALIPKGCLRIARRFNAGDVPKCRSVPKERLKITPSCQPSRRDLRLSPASPALKRRAILKCSSGTNTKAWPCTVVPYQLSIHTLWTRERDNGVWDLQMVPEPIFLKATERNVRIHPEKSRDERHQAPKRMIEGFYIPKRQKQNPLSRA